MCNMDCIRWEARTLSGEEVNGKRVFEVDSHDVNGSLRYIVELLEPAEYVGVDVVSDPNVEKACPAEQLVQKFGKECFDVVIFTCMLEHVRDWVNSISNIKNICKRNGIIVIIVPSRSRYRGFPHDFWRYRRKDMESIFSDFEILTLEEAGTRKLFLVYAKIRKPHGFLQNDLSQHKLYSMVPNRECSEIQDDDFQTFYFNYVILKHKARTLMKKGVLFAAAKF